MAKTGAVPLNDLVVSKVLHVSTGTSVIVASKGNFTITIERTAPFPDDMHVRPGGTLDLLISYEPKA